MMVIRTIMDVSVFAPGGRARHAKIRPLWKFHTLNTLGLRLNHGAEGGTRTPMPFGRHPLKMVCLPISPLPRTPQGRLKSVFQAKRRGTTSIAKTMTEKSAEGPFGSAPCGRFAQGDRQGLEAARVTHRSRLPSTSQS